jgi:outer membrane receptor protein involved in Fe transport
MPLAAQDTPAEPAPASPASPPASIETYPRAFFDRFYPQTALELLQRVPGFSLDAGAELRGFSGAAGNVLVDGERPTIKSGGLEDFLRRIPANAVERIEVTRGAQRAGETAGQSLVANVIRKPQIFAGTWSGELERNPAGLVYPRGELSFTAPIGAWSTTTKVNAFWEQFTFDNIDRIRRDAAGALVSFDEETLPSTLRDAFIATEAQRLVAGGTLTINARFGNSRFYQETGRDGFLGRLPDGGPADRRSDIRFDSEFWAGELSADWTGKVSQGWVLKLLALGSFQDGEQSSANVVAEPPGAAPVINRFASEDLPIEVLTRATIGKLEGSFRPEFGIEAAYNRLDSRIALEVEDASGVRPIILPASDVTVAEWRGETFGNIVWALAPRWTLEGGLAAEFSQITVSGDAAGRNEFHFLKPSVALTWQASDALQLRGALRRTVGQLDFSDFAASANAEDDRFLAGNPDLGPDQTWRASVTGDLRLKGGYALNVQAFHEWREDVLEQIVLPSGVPGLANAGLARVWGIESEAAVPLTGLLKGGLFEVSADFRDAAFTDPITGQTRVVTDLTNPEITIDFRQDLTEARFAWGARYEPPLRTATFFANEEIIDRRGRRITAFVETTRFFGMKMQLEFRNIGQTRFPRDRQLFAPDRSAALIGSEVLDRERGEFVKFTISDQF